MTSVGVFEAKTLLSALLQRVERGSDVTITRHGKAAAKIVPAAVFDRDAARALVQRMRKRADAEGATATLKDVLDRRDQGRR